MVLISLRQPYVPGEQANAKADKSSNNQDLYRAVTSKQASRPLAESS